MVLPTENIPPSTLDPPSHSIESPSPGPSAGDGLSSIAEKVAAKAPDVDPEAVERERIDREREEAEKLRADMKAGKKVKGSKISRTTETETKTMEEKAFLSGCRQSGREFIDSLIMTAGTFIHPKWYYRQGTKVKGPDGKEQDIDEREYMREMWADFFEAHRWRAKKGTIFSIVISTGMYISARVEVDKAKVAGARGAFWGWVKGVWHTMFQKKEAEYIPPQNKDGQ